MKCIHGKTSRFCTVFLFVAVIFLQPVIDVRADDSVQDKEVLEAVEKVAPIVEEIAKTLWDLSEVSLLEIKSSVYLKDLLKNNGFTITSEGTAGHGCGHNLVGAGAILAVCLLAILIDLSGLRIVG